MFSILLLLLLRKHSKYMYAKCLNFPCFIKKIGCMQSCILYVSSARLTGVCLIFSYTTIYYFLWFPCFLYGGKLRYATFRGWKWNQAKVPKRTGWANIISSDSCIWLLVKVFSGGRKLVTDFHQFNLKQVNLFVEIAWKQRGLSWILAWFLAWNLGNFSVIL